MPTSTFDSNLFYNGIQRIGDGGFGVLVLAEHILDNQLYAVKETPLREELKAEARREVEALAILAKLANPNIVQYFTSWYSPKRLKVQ
jgi:serine/threonine protein kinase